MSILIDFFFNPKARCWWDKWEQTGWVRYWGEGECGFLFVCVCIDVPHTVGQRVRNCKFIKNHKCNSYGEKYLFSLCNCLLAVEPHQTLGKGLKCASQCWRLRHEKVFPETLWNKAQMVLPWPLGRICWNSAQIAYFLPWGPPMAILRG